MLHFFWEYYTHILVYGTYVTTFKSYGNALLKYIQVLPLYIITGLKGKGWGCCCFNVH